MARKEVCIVSYNPVSADEGAMRFKNKNYSNTRALTDDEVRAIMEVISCDNSILGLRNKIIVLLLATTGMRREELASLKIGSLKKSDGQDMFEFLGKGNKERMVVIAKTIRNLIDEYLSMRGVTLFEKTLPLFISHSTNMNNRIANKPITPQSIYNVIKAVADEANIDASSVSPHCFRHTYVTRSLKMGIRLEDIQDRVGHSDISTTKRYAHSNNILEGNPADALADLYTNAH
jgi:integrase/recombinase XerD